MVPVPMPRFEGLVADALDAVPDELAQLMDNVIVLVEDRHGDEADLLGLYEGIPLTERDDYGGFAMPDRVTVYRLPLCAMCDSEQELVDQVTITVIHELAHHFGIDDDVLHDLGWG
jgi:predicted Zn-dependent protease with MMP-like domain